MSDKYAAAADRSEKWTQIYVEDAQKIRRNRRH